MGGLLERVPGRKRQRGQRRVPTQVGEVTTKEGRADTRV